MTIEVQWSRTSARSSSIWLTTFADLAALLLSFFVLTFSMATMRQGDLQALSSSFLSRTEVGDNPEQNFVATAHSIPQQRTNAAPTGEYLAAILQARLNEVEVVGHYAIEAQPDTVNVSLGPTMMEAGAGSWAPDGRRLAGTIFDMVEQEGAHATVFVTRRPGETALAGLTRAAGLGEDLGLMARRAPIQLFSLPFDNRSELEAVRVEIRPQGGR